MEYLFTKYTNEAIFHLKYNKYSIQGIANMCLVAISIIRCIYFTLCRNKSKLEGCTKSIAITIRVIKENKENKKDKYDKSYYYYKQTKIISIVIVIRIRW